jgi:hypothetical protein
MAEGYNDGQAEPLDEGMDEFLCEYVDGSMDPVVLKAFEEYLRANPHMAEHAQCLCQARELLATHVPCPHPTGALQLRLKEAIANDLLGESGTSVTPQLGSFAVVTSAVGLMLMLGMLFGTAVVQYRAAPEYRQVERERVPSDAYPKRAAVLPRPYLSLSQASFGVEALAVPLPILAASADITPLSRVDTLSAVAGE